VNGSRELRWAWQLYSTPQPSELIDGLVALIHNPELTDTQLMQYIPGPDFPTEANFWGQLEFGIYHWSRFDHHARGGKLKLLNSGSPDREDYHRAAVPNEGGTD